MKEQEEFHRLGPEIVEHLQRLSQSGAVGQKSYFIVVKLCCNIMLLQLVVLNTSFHYLTECVAGSLLDRCGRHCQ